MSLEEAFVADICERPDDDAPRLVYADWLLENGDPDRAEFIRLQIERERLPEDEPRWLKLLERELGLLSHHRQQWQEEADSYGLSWPEFCRGFVEAGWVPAGGLLEVAEGLFLRLPIRDLGLFNASPLLGELSRCPWLGRLRALRLMREEEPLPLAGLLSLLTSPHLTGLQSLDLTGCFLGSSAMMAFLANTCRMRPTELGLGGTGLAELGITSLLLAPVRSRLEVLDLRNNGLGDGAVSALARCRSPLRWLFLDGNAITDAGIDTLLASSSLAGVSHLTCDSEPLSPEIRARLLGRFPRCLDGLVFEP